MECRSCRVAALRQSIALWRNMVQRTSKSPPRRRPGKGNITAAIHELDAQHSLGMHGSGDDWSKLPNSKRTDRPLDPETLRELTRKSDFLGLSRFGGNCALIVLTGFAILAAADRWREGWPVPVLAVLSIWQGFLLSAPVSYTHLTLPTILLV